MSTQFPPNPDHPGRSPPPAAGRGSCAAAAARGDRRGCGGIGRYLGVDPVLLRIAFIVLALANGLG